MEIEIGQVVRKEGAPTEVTVRFWDETKPTPQDMLEAKVYLRTEETNIYILKVQALVKAQELIVHNAGIALGKDDELLNDYILMHESIKGIPGVPPLVSFPPIPQVEIPQHILDWREGDPITAEHREIISSQIISTFNLTPERAAEARESHARVPDEHIGYNLAVTIAFRTGMDAETFKRAFPKAAASGSLIVKFFLENSKGKE